MYVVRKCPWTLLPHPIPTPPQPHVVSEHIFSVASPLCPCASECPAAEHHVRGAQVSLNVIAPPNPHPNPTPCCIGAHLQRSITSVSMCKWVSSSVASRMCASVLERYCPTPTQSHPNPMWYRSTSSAYHHLCVHVQVSVQQRSIMYVVRKCPWTLLPHPNLSHPNPMWYRSTSSAYHHLCVHVQVSVQQRSIMYVVRKCPWTLLPHPNPHPNPMSYPSTSSA